MVAKTTICLQCCSLLAPLAGISGNGTLDKEEIKQAMAKLGSPLSDNEVDDIFAKIDLDGKLVGDVGANSKWHTIQSRIPTDESMYWE